MSKSVLVSIPDSFYDRLESSPIRNNYGALAAFLRDLAEQQLNAIERSMLPKEVFRYIEGRTQDLITALRNMGHTEREIARQEKLFRMKEFNNAFALKQSIDEGKIHQHMASVPQPIVRPVTGKQILSQGPIKAKSADKPYENTMSDEAIQAETLRIEKEAADHLKKVRAEAVEAPKMTLKDVQDLADVYRVVAKETYGLAYEDELEKAGHLLGQLLKQYGLDNVTTADEEKALTLAEQKGKIPV